MTTEPSRWAVAAQAVEDAPRQVRMYRRVLGLTLRDTADEIGLSFTTLHRLERGGSVYARHYPLVLRWLDENRERVGVVIDEDGRDV